MPFSVDQEFWSEKENDHLKKDGTILFIGNDGKRDYKFVIELAKEMPSLDFVFITKKIDSSELQSKNIKLLSGKWDDLNITDSDIKNYYS